MEKEMLLEILRTAANLIFAKVYLQIILARRYEIAN